MESVCGKRTSKGISNMEITSDLVRDVRKECEEEFHKAYKIAKKISLINDKVYNALNIFENFFRDSELAEYFGMNGYFDFKIPKGKSLSDIKNITSDIFSKHIFDEWILDFLARRSRNYLQNLITGLKSIDNCSWIKSDNELKEIISNLNLKVNVFINNYALRLKNGTFFQSDIHDITDVAVTYLDQGLYSPLYLRLGHRKSDLNNDQLSKLMDKAKEELEKYVKGKEFDFSKVDDASTIWWGVTELIEDRKSNFQLGDYKGYSGALKCCLKLIENDNCKYPSKEKAFMEINPEIYNEWRTKILICRNIIKLLQIIPKQYLGEYRIYFTNYLSRLILTCIDCKWKSNHIFYSSLFLEVFSEFLNYFMPRLTPKTKIHSKSSVNEMAVQSEGEKNTAGSISERISNSDMDADYFRKDLKITIQSSPKKGGFLIINGKKVKLSDKELSICRIMDNKLKENWYDVDSKFAEAGWVSYEEFIKKVDLWKESEVEDVKTTEQTINKAFNYLRRKIKNKTKINGEDIIENGAKIGTPGCYRFKVDPDNLR